MGWPPECKVPTSIKVGCALTLVTVAIFVLLALRNVCVLLPAEVLECRKSFFWFLDSSPNEIGDTLAGFAGTLAFIWIIVTVWLQSSELEAQRSVLVEQKEEFKLMVAAQNEQVRALQAQARIFETEREVRDQIEVAIYIDELVEELRLQLNAANTIDDFEFEWCVTTDEGMALKKIFKTGPLNGMNAKLEKDKLRQASAAVENFLRHVLDQSGTYRLLRKSARRSVFDDLATKVVAIGSEARLASSAKRKSLENLGLLNLECSLGKLLDVVDQDGLSIFEEIMAP